MGDSLEEAPDEASVPSIEAARARTDAWTASVASRAHAAFVALGFTVSYALGDALFNNLSAFMACLPGGLLLPDRVVIAGNVATILALALFAARVALRGLPDHATNVRYVSAALVLVLADAFCLALFWRTVVFGVPIVVLFASFVANAIGTLSWLVFYPFIASYYREELISSAYLGSTLGSLLGGAMGLLQQATGGTRGAFGPMPFLLVVGVLFTTALFAWRTILRSDLGRLHDKPAAAQADPSLANGEIELVTRGPLSAPVLNPTAAVPTGSLEQRASMLTRAETRSHGSSSRPQHGGEPPHRWEEARRRIVLISRRSLPAWLLAVPMNMSTWGASPNILQFAAAHAGCACSPTDPRAEVAYRQSSSLSYLAMPVAAYLSLRCPTHSLRHLTILAAIQAGCFLLEVAGVAAAPAMTCSDGAVGVLIIAVFTMRGIDTYVTTMLYRVVSQLFKEDRDLQAGAAYAFGALLCVSTFAATILCYSLVATEVVRCSLPDVPDAGSLAANVSHALADADTSLRICDF